MLPRVGDNFGENRYHHGQFLYHAHYLQSHIINRLSPCERKITDGARPLHHSIMPLNWRSLDGNPPSLAPACRPVATTQPSTRSTVGTPGVKGRAELANLVHCLTIFPGAQELPHRTNGLRAHWIASKFLCLKRQLFLHAGCRATQGGFVTILYCGMCGGPISHA